MMNLLHPTKPHPLHPLERIWALLLFCLFPLLFPSNLVAKDFGVCGNTLPVKEENLKEVLAKRASKLPKSAQTILQHKASRPQPIPLKNATEKRRLIYVPSYIAPKTIKDLDGKIIVKKGQTINPLDTLVPDEGLLFFDGTNPSHLAFAKSQEGTFAWILTKGAPLALEESENRPIYFDQSGKLSRELGIEAIPAKVIPVKGKLIIEEIPIKRGGLLCR